jgi:hypothetical protein
MSATVDALRYYEVKALEMQRASLRGDSKSMLSLMQELAIDGGSIARRAIDKEAAPEPATVSSGPAIDLVISPNGGISADFSSDKTRRAFARQIRKFKELESEPAAVAPATGALEALLAASDAVIERWHTPLWKDARPTAEYIAALRLAAESARKLLAGGE